MDRFIDQLNNQQEQITDLASKLKTIEDRRNDKGLDRYTDNDSKNVIGKIVSDRLFEMSWSNLFHYSTFFESLDGVTQTLSGVGALITLTGPNVAIYSGTASGASATLSKAPDTQGMLTFVTHSNFRTSFQQTVDASGSLSATTAYLIVGTVAGGIYYGFKLTSGNIYGVTRDGSTEKSVLLQTYVAGTTYSLEALYYPATKVSFRIDAIEKGISTSNLPTVTASSNFYQFSILNSEALRGKTLKISFFEYLQERNTTKFLG